MREVRQLQQEISQLALDTIEVGFEALDFVTQARDLREQRCRVFALALRDADLLGQRIAPRLQVLRVHLDIFARGFERFEARHVERDAALFQRGSDQRNIVTQQIDIEHS